MDDPLRRTAGDGVAPVRSTGRSTWRRWARRLASVLLVALALPLPIALAYRFVPPPATPLMAIRLAEGETLRYRWVPMSRIAPALQRAVIASEDEKFCSHHGFDWASIAAAWRSWRAGGRLRGASTISMQTAKNLFLWPGRSVLRKGVEAYLTVVLESLWSKRRILETYLNVIEWGHGVYGAEMAARLHFGKPAAALTPREAALLAAVLPNPRRWSADHPSPYVIERAETILRRMPAMDVPGRQGCG